MSNVNIIAKSHKHDNKRQTSGSAFFRQNHKQKQAWGCNTLQLGVLSQASTKATWTNKQVAHECYLYQKKILPLQSPWRPSNLAVTNTGKYQTSTRSDQAYSSLSRLYANYSSLCLCEGEKRTFKHGVVTWLQPQRVCSTACCLAVAAPSRIGGFPRLSGLSCGD